MPYKKSYGKRKRYSKRSYRGGGSFWNSFSKNYKTVSKYTNFAEIWSAISKLRGLVNSEMHKLDMAASNSVTTAGVIDPMCKVAVGDTYADRTGNSIYARALNIKGFCQLGASETSNIIRLAIVHDTQQISDTTPALTDIYEAVSVNAHLAPATVGRFKVLYDKCYTFDANNVQRKWEINLPMRHHVRYNGTATTDLQKGALYFVQMSNYVTNAPVCAYKARLSFHDN